jgi:hypothetical protein
MKKEGKKKDERGGGGGTYTPRVWSSSCLGCPSGHPPISQRPLYNYLLYESNPLLMINAVPRVVNRRCDSVYTL